MSFAAMLSRALIAWSGSDRSYRQREPAALVLTTAAGAGRGQLGVRQTLLPGLRLLRVRGIGNGQFSVPLPETAWDCGVLPAGLGGSDVGLGAADGEAEQVAEPADVAAGGQGLVQDAVLADG
jgi:hypothetical protein